MRCAARSRFAMLGALLWAGSLAVGGLACSGDALSKDSGLEGLTLVYRFETGRTYRAAYAAETVRFELLEPRQPEPPSAHLPYRLRTLRDGLFLVVWDDPEFHTTFVIDLERRRLHASALRAREGVFLGTAQIVEVATR